MRKTSGIGLVEVMVAATLGFLLLGLLHRFLLPVIHTSTKVSARSHFSEQANIALNRLSKDLQHGTSAGLSYIAPTTADSSLLAISRRDGLTAAGRNRYENKAVVYFVDPVKKQLRRRVWPPGPPSIPGVSPTFNASTKFTQDQLLRFLTTPSKGIHLASDVAEFEALETWPPGPVVTSRLVLEKQVSVGQTTRFELQKQTAFRN